MLRRVKEFDLASHDVKRNGLGALDNALESLLRHYLCCRIILTQLYYVYHYVFFVGTSSVVYGLEKHFLPYLACPVGCVIAVGIRWSPLRHWQRLHGGVLRLEEGGGGSRYLLGVPHRCRYSGVLKQGHFILPHNVFPQGHAGLLFMRKCSVYDWKTFRSPVPVPPLEDDYLVVLSQNLVLFFASRVGRLSLSLPSVLCFVQCAGCIPPSQTLVFGYRIRGRVDVLLRHGSFL